MIQQSQSISEFYSRHLVPVLLYVCTKLSKEKKNIDFASSIGCSVSTWTRPPPQFPSTSKPGRKKAMPRLAWTLIRSFCNMWCRVLYSWNYDHINNSWKDWLKKFKEAKWKQEKKKEKKFWHVMIFFYVSNFSSFIIIIIRKLFPARLLDTKSMSDLVALTSYIRMMPVRMKGGGTQQKKNLK